MELSGLIASLRKDVLDDANEPYLYSSAALASFLNDAVRQVCLRARALVDSVGPEATTYTVAAGVRGVKLHPAVLAVRQARLGSATLKGTTAKRLWKFCPDWDISEAGDACWWVPDYQDGWLYFDRPVLTDTTLTLSVWRMPLDGELLEGDVDEPVIPQHWHQDLLDWAAYMAFSSKDSEQRDDSRAAGYVQAFEAKVGRLPSMTEVRLWGISPVVGVPAEFI